MPAYPGPNQAKLMRENTQVQLWQNDTVPAGVLNGSLSMAVQLERVRSAHYPWGFSVEVAFSGAPGVFEVDIMGADTDNANYYVTLRTIAAVNAGNVGRVDILDTWVKYVALYMRTLPNAVTVTGQITR